MPYSRKEIEEMLERIKPGEYKPVRNVDGWVVGTELKTEFTASFILKAPSIIRQLLDEREEMKRKIEGMKRWNAGQGDSCSYHSGDDSNSCNCEYYNQALDEVLNLFE